MEMRGARMLATGLAVLAVALGAGCRKAPKDESKVIANIGGTKITQDGFAKTVRLLVGDDQKANDLLGGAAYRDQRNGILQEIADQRTIIQYAEQQGLAQDPKVQLLLEAAKANAYGQILMERLVPKGDPGEAELRAFYDEFAAKSKAMGQAANLPPYEQVKAQLPQALRRRQAQQASESIMTSAKAAVATTIDPEYKASAPAALGMK